MHELITNLEISFDRYKLDENGEKRRLTKKEIEEIIKQRAEEISLWFEEEQIKKIGFSKGKFKLYSYEFRASDHNILRYQLFFSQDHTQRRSLSFLGNTER